MLLNGCQRYYNVHFGEFLKTWSLRSNSVTRQVSFKRTKIGGKCQNWKTQMQFIGWFSNTVSSDSVSFINDLGCLDTINDFLSCKVTSMVFDTRYLKSFDCNPQGFVLRDYNGPLWWLYQCRWHILTWCWTVDQTWDNLSRDVLPENMRRGRTLWSTSDSRRSLCS